MSKQKRNANKEFRLASWAIDNPSVIYVMIGIFFVMGLSAYFSMPREDFPEVQETKIYVSTPYPGNTAEDIERLITDPLEEKLKNVSNLVELTSTSQEDYSMIVVEFDEDITVENAKQKVKDEVDAEKAGEDWPVFNGAKVEPNSGVRDPGCGSRLIQELGTPARGSTNRPGIRGTPLACWTCGAPS